MPAVVSVNVGAVELLPHGRRSVPSAIRKRPVAGPVRIETRGLAGDEQADTRHHGGPDKAVLLFALEQYEPLARHIGRGLEIPAFGENLTLTGLTEHDACLGDVVRVGTATFQVAQPRNPCYKQAALHGVKDLVLEVERTGCTGWYVRVLEPGVVAAGDSLDLVERPHPEATVALVNRVLHPRDDATVDGDLIRRLLTIPSLGSALRGRLEHLSHGEIEDPRSRRNGPAA